MDMPDSPTSMLLASAMPSPRLMLMPTTLLDTPMPMAMPDTPMPMAMLDTPMPMPLESVMLSPRLMPSTMVPTPMPMATLPTPMLMPDTLMPMASKKLEALSILLKSITCRILYHCQLSQ